MWRLRQSRDNAAIIAPENRKTTALFEIPGDPMRRLLALIPALTVMCAAIAPGYAAAQPAFSQPNRAPPQDAWSLLDLERLTKARPGVRHILLVALNTGLRRADLCRVAWTNVDWQAGVIRLVTSKGERAGRRIVVPLTRPLRAVLQEIGPQREGPILRNAHGLAWSVDGMAHAVNIELKRLGVSGRLHGLRRSAATHLAQQGASSRRIAQVLGWSEGDAEAMAAIYVQEGM